MARCERLAGVGVLQHCIIRSSLGVFRVGQGNFDCSKFALTSINRSCQANYVAAELKKPSSQLPLAVNTAIPTIIVCYVAANAVYYILLPWKVVSTTDAAAVTAVTHFLGKGVAYFATVLICLVILGSLLGNSFVAGRMTVAAANKNWLPSILGTVGKIGTWKASRGVEDESADDAMDKGESPM